MRKTIVACIACAGALALGAAPASAATKPTEATAIGFGGPDNLVSVVGAIRSPAQRCEGGRSIALVASTDDGRRRLGTDLTSRNGGFYFEEKVPPTTNNLFVAVKRERVSAKLTCAPTASEVQFGGSGVR